MLVAQRLGTQKRPMKSGSGGLRRRAAKPSPIPLEHRRRAAEFAQFDPVPRDLVLYMFGDSKLSTLHHHTVQVALGYKLYLDKFVTTAHRSGGSLTPSDRDALREEAVDAVRTIITQEAVGQPFTPMAFASGWE